VICGVSRISLNPTIIKVGKTEDLTDRLLDYLNPNHDDCKNIKDCHSTPHLFKTD
jgi:hypothetical protein